MNARTRNDAPTISDEIHRRLDELSDRLDRLESQLPAIPARALGLTRATARRVNDTALRVNDAANAAAEDVGRQFGRTPRRRWTRPPPAGRPRWRT